LDINFDGLIFSNVEDSVFVLEMSDFHNEDDDVLFKPLDVKLLLLFEKKVVAEAKSVSVTLLS
jgi:hypothetical protein